MSELVIADAPYRVYPGGVIVLPAVEWLGAGRGTLTTEADTRSAYGTVVRDTQKVTESIFDRESLSQTNALAEADDTLVVDLADLPIEVGFRYHVFVSLLIEGDWDPTNEDTYRGGHQESHNLSCNLRYWLDTLSTLGQTRVAQFKPRAIDSYRIVQMVGITPVLDGDEIMTWRAYAQDGTDLEFLLDQIYFVPSDSTSTDEWNADDFEAIPGNWSTSGTGGAGDGFVDGTDGGDDNGQYTWHPNVFDQPIGSGGDGGGDYQQDDSEYMIRVQPDDLLLVNSITQARAAAHLYGIHGPFYVPAQQWMDDDFTRTLGDNNYAGADNHFLGQTWGISPEGFGWRSMETAGPTTVLGQRVGRTAWVDGDEAGMEVRAGGLGARVRCFLRSYGTESGTSVGASIRAENIDFAGAFRREDGGSGANTPTVRVGSETPSSTIGQACIIELDLDAGTWNLKSADLTITVAGPFTTPAAANIGFRLEIRRYLVRAKVWDASGAEPGTWDAEEFRPLLFSGAAVAYDYGDDEEISIGEADACTVFIDFQVLSSTATDFTRVLFNQLTIDHDPGGTNEAAWVSVEKPEGTEIDRIELPAGCQHLVYHGTRDWTEPDGFGDPFVTFSAKAWNEVGAAELQRSECPWWWLRTVHGGVVSMLWTSATSAAITRVHA